MTLPPPLPGSSGSATRYRVRHATAYDYGEDVPISHHLLPLTARPHPRQRIRRSQLTIDPVPAVRSDRVDYFGNTVTYVAVQVAVFIIAAVVVSLGPVRRALTPKSLKAARVHKAAMEQFLSHGLHLTQNRTGVLLFAAAAEHRAEVIADEGIYAAAPREVWDQVVDLLVAGLKRGDPAAAFEAAVRRSGEILAAHVPPHADGNPNELPDHLVVLPRIGQV